MPKNIGIDARFCTSSSTGIGRHVFELIQQLAKLDKKNNYTIFLKPEIFKTFTLPGPNFTKEKTTAPHYSFAEQWNFLKQINSHNFDLMIFPHFNAPILYTRPFVVTIHDLTLHFFPGKKKSDIISRLAYKLVINRITKKAKHCFAVSTNTKKDMIKHLGIPSSKITVAHNGISTNFKPIADQQILKIFKQKYKLPEKYFLYSGVSRSHKNISRLIKGFSIFLQRHPESNIKLVLSGPKDPKYNEIPQLIKNLNLENKIIQTGFFPEKDINKLFSGALGYCFPSLYEGFGIPPLEAMACGIPTAVSNTSSLPEACGNAAIYFDPYNLEEIALSLEKLAFDEKTRKICIQQGFQQCKKFSWELMTKTMLKKYKIT